MDHSVYNSWVDSCTVSALVQHFVSVKNEFMLYFNWSSCISVIKVMDSVA